MAESKTKAQIVNEEKVEKAEANINHAVNTWTETLREAGKAVADSALTMQDHNVHFAQSIIEQGFEQFESQTKTLHKLYSTVVGQSDERRAAFRDVAREAVSAYGSLLTAPVKFYRQAIKNVREADED